MKLRAALALGLAFTLSACWNSSAPLMPASALDAPPIKGKYASVSSNPADPVIWYRATPKGKVVLLEKRISKDDEEENWLADRTFSFDALGGSLYLVQSVNAAATERNYVVMRITGDGDDVHVLTPSCDAKAAADYGAAFSGNMCTFDSYAKVLAAAKKVVAKTASDPASVTYKAEDYRRAD